MGQAGMQWREKRQMHAPPRLWDGAAAASGAATAQAMHRAPLAPICRYRYALSNHMAGHKRLARLLDSAATLPACEELPRSLAACHTAHVTRLCVVEWPASSLPGSWQSGGRRHRRWRRRWRRLLASRSRWGSPGAGVHATSVVLSAYVHTLFPQVSGAGEAVATTAGGCSECPHTHECCCLGAPLHAPLAGTRESSLALAAMAESQTRTASCYALVAAALRGPQHAHAAAVMCRDHRNALRRRLHPCASQQCLPLPSGVQAIPLLAGWPASNSLKALQHSRTIPHLHMRVPPPAPICATTFAHTGYSMASRTVMQISQGGQERLAARG